MKNKFFRYVVLILAALVVLAARPLAQAAQALDFTWTPELLAGIVGGAFTLVFTYFPSLNEGYAGLPTTTKSLIMIGLLALASVVVYLGQCTLGLWNANLVCGQPGILLMLQVFYYALIGNVATYVVAPQPKAVRAALLSRGMSG